MKKIDTMMLGIHVVEAYLFGETTVAIYDFTDDCLVNQDGSYHVSAGNLFAGEILACRFAGTLEDCRKYINQLPQDVSFNPYYGHDCAEYDGRAHVWFLKTIAETKQHFEKKAVIYDFDPNWDAPDGSDEYGDYVIRAIRYRSDDGTLLLANGTRSQTYKICGNS